MAAITEERLRLDLVGAKGSMDLEQYRQHIEKSTGEDLSYSHLSNMMRGEAKGGRALNEVVLKFLGWERVTVTTFRKVGKR